MMVSSSKPFLTVVWHSNFGKAARILMLLWVSQTSAIAQTIQGKVVGVTDGDTITVLDQSKIQHKIRLSGIDAPERGMPFGQKSKDHLADVVAGKQVVVETSKLDRYKRRVGKVLVDGQDANLAQIEAGFAWHYKDYEREQSRVDRLAYTEAEERAREARKGLWLDREPIPPWDWRKRSKN